MKHSHASVILCLFFLLVGCQGTTTLTSPETTTPDNQFSTETEPGSSSGVGIIVSNPLFPKNSVFPTFELYINEFFSGVDLATLISTNQDSSDNPTETNAIEMALKAMQRSSFDRFVLEKFGAEIARVVNESGTREVTSAITSVAVDYDFGRALTDVPHWTVDYKIEPTNPNYIRLYFRNRDTNHIEGTMVFRPGKDGLFAYINPKLLQAQPTDARGLVRMIAYDFSNNSNHLMVSRHEQYDPKTNYSAVDQFHYQCQPLTNTCVIEFLRPGNSSNSSFLHKNSLRFKWNTTSSSEICLTRVNYDNQNIVVYDGTLWGFSTANNDFIYTGKECETVTPIWGNHAFSITDLITPFDNTTTPPEGTAVFYYGNGLSTTTWDTLTPDLIAKWLAGET